MTTPVYDPPRGRNSFIGYVALCALGIVVVVGAYLGDLLASVRSGVVEVPVRVDATADVPQPPGGATVRAAQMLLQVRTADVPAGAVTAIRIGDAAGALLVVALIAVVGWIALRISRGRLFDASMPRILDLLGVTVVLLGVVPAFVRHLGWNWVVSGLGWQGRLPEPVAEPMWLPIYIGLLVVVCFRFALTASQRMVRDQAGLV